MRWRIGRRRKLILAAVAVALVVLVTSHVARPVPRAIWIRQPLVGRRLPRCGPGAWSARTQDDTGAVVVYELPGDRLILLSGKPGVGGYLVSEVRLYDPDVNNRVLLGSVERVECPWSPWSLVPAVLRPE